MNLLMVNCLEYIPTTYDNTEKTQELTPNVLQLMQWFHKFTNLHPQAQQKPVNGDDIYNYAY
jgi:DNA-binding HxlR family transcriptional regulator